MYFNHAYQKTLINTGSGSVTSTGNPAVYSANFFTTAGAATTAIPAGRVAVVSSLNTTSIGGPAANAVIDTSVAFAYTLQQLPMVYLAQGSINTVDKLGPFAGGYQESVKTKGINPKYVNRFFRVDPSCPVAEEVNVCLCDGAAAQCGTSYYLRIDVKGSPALRFLTHNAYRTYASSNVCCPQNPTDPADLNIDPMQVQTSWAWQIARDPIMNNFILPILTWNAGSGTTTFNVAAWYAANPTLTDTDLYTAIQNEAGDYPYGNSEEEDYVPGDTSAQCIKLIGSYVDTQFGTCSFHPQDFYELAPVKIYPSITDQQGDPCVDQIWCTSYDEYGVQGSGYGHKLLRDAILFRRYMQEQYVYDPRLREVMNQDQVYNYIIGTNFYTTYGILHSVPRFNNPTSTFDNDQYLITIVMPILPDGTCSTSSNVETFEDWMNAYLAEAGNGVQLEYLS